MKPVRRFQTFHFCALRSLELWASLSLKKVKEQAQPDREGTLESKTWLSGAVSQKALKLSFWKQLLGTGHLPCDDTVEWGNGNPLCPQLLQTSTPVPRRETGQTTGRWRLATGPVPSQPRTQGLRSRDLHVWEQSHHPWDLAAVNGGRSLTLSEPQFPHSLVEESGPVIPFSSAHPPGCDPPAAVRQTSHQQRMDTSQQVPSSLPRERG